MNSALRLCVLAPLALVFLAVPGCGQKDALAFNDNIAKSMYRLNAAVDIWARAIDKGNMVQARQAQKNAEETVAAIKAEAQSWKVPKDSSAKNLFDSHQRLLKIEAEAVNHFGQIADILENAKLSPEQKTEKLHALAGDIEAREKAANADFLDMQRAFAKAHNIKLVPATK